MDWAFNLDTPELDRKYEVIPDCDIIVSHGPPFGYGDYSPYEQQQCGSQAFVDAIDRIQPKLVVFGHIHEGSGKYERGQTTLINATHMDANYRPLYKPWVIEMEGS
jgi:Icc-related predicted phosphoesterase